MTTPTRKLFSPAIFWLLLAGHALPTQAATEEELLEPDKAFALSVRARDAQTLEAHWTIANGYYLYREKFKFESLDPAVQLKPAQIPPGIRKRDEFFGEVETFRNSVKVLLPVARSGNGAQSVKLRITSQGCADLGVCYPPQTRELSVMLPALSAAKPGEIKSLNELSRLIDGPGKSTKFLPVEEAFKIHVERRDNHSLIARLNVAKGYYLYRDKTGFTLSQGDGVSLGRYELPAGEIKDDPFIGKTAVYHDSVEVELPYTRTGNGATPISVKADYQGCADKGICYPPSTQHTDLVLPAIAAAVPVETSEMSTPTTANETPSTATRTPISTEKWILALLAAFGTGLLLTFTPCVLPMIPILSSVIVGSSDRHVTKLEGGLLSSAYVLGTAVTYTIAGVIAGASGDQLQAYFQHPAAIFTFSGLLVFLALSMFGFYELQLPSFLQSKLHEHSADIHLKTKHTKVGALFGVFGMGLVAALVVGACVSPLLISALGVAIANRDPLLGGGIMFSMALGMGVILIAIGVGAGFLMPKAGAWMEKVKYVFGVMLLAVAIYLLGVLPDVPVLLLWAALFIVIGVYLGATQGLPAGANGWRYLWKGIGTVALIWGVLALIGGFSGERDILKPLPPANIATLTGQMPGAPASAAGETHFTRVTTLATLNATLAEARAQNKLVMLDYYATWCTDCVRMEKSTFTDPRVRAALMRFVLVKADVTDNNADAIAIKQAHEVFGPPATLFFMPDGREIRTLRFYGYRNADDFLAILAKI